MRLPKGFVASGVEAGIKKGRVDLAMFYAPEGANAAAIFTTNRFKAAPVILAREGLQKSSGRVSAVLINAGCANAMTGKKGLDAARRIRKNLAGIIECDTQEVFLASTGTIGIPLPETLILQALPAAINSLSTSGLDSASKAILTTDTGTKVASAHFMWKGKRGTITGVAKGAGMIHPNMATMLVFIMTDAPATHKFLKIAIKQASDKSFHAISVDGDTSTNDTVLIMASGKLGGNQMTDVKDSPEFCDALTKVCRSLAYMIVRDGEGASRVMEIQIEGALSNKEAKLAAHAVATSPLVKTALHGGDPNWGRIMAAVGRSGARFIADRTSLKVGNMLMVKQGEPTAYSEERAASIFAKERVSVIVNLGSGHGTASIMTCDIGHNYVSLNAEYRT